MAEVLQREGRRERDTYTFGSLDVQLCRAPQWGWHEWPAMEFQANPEFTIELDVQFRVPQYQGIKKNPEANVDQAHLRFWIDPTAWQAALALQDVGTRYAYTPTQ
eukprot:3571152-Amphidinium_carterae.1